MRVLQINAVYGFSSTGRTTLELTNALIEQGHEAYVAYSNATITSHNGYQIGGVLEKKIHGFLSRLFGNQGYYSTYSTTKLLEYIDTINPDIIHLRNLHDNYINVRKLMNYIAEHNIAVVVTLHDCWFFTGRCCYYTEDNCFKWKESCGSCPRLKKDNVSWFFDRSRKMLKDKEQWYSKINKFAVVGVSDWITYEARKSILKNALLIKRIYNWIDLEVFKPQDTIVLRKKLGLEKTFVVLGVSQRWSQQKGLDVFIELANKVQDNTKIVLIGSIPNGTILPQNVICIGTTNSVAELAMYYSMADVFVNPSIQETFGKVTAEALASGTPAIVNNSTANPELIGTGCGYILENTDSTSILEAIKDIRTKDKSCYSSFCISHAKRNFNMSDRIKDYIALYERLIESDVEK